MSKIFSLTRSRARRTRTATALATAGALVLATGAVMLSSATATADSDDNNNSRPSHSQGGQNDNKGGNDDNHKGGNDDNKKGGNDDNKKGGNDDDKGKGNDDDKGKGNDDDKGKGNDKVWYKSYVCKYVGKPGVDERLQTGQNPIWVSNASLGLGPKGLARPGQEFNDRHGRSVVIVANTGKLSPEPGVGNCPAVKTPPPTSPPPSSPPPGGGGLTVTPLVSTIDPCGTANDSYTTNAVSGGVTRFTVTESNRSTSGVTLTFTPAAGYTILGGNTARVAWTNEPCVLGSETAKPKPKPKPDVKGSEGTKPRPAAAPTVLGTHAAVPTAVNAGLAGTPASTGTTQALAQLLVGAGLLLLVAAGWMGLGRRDDGTHQA